MTVTIGRATASRQRRESAAERLSAMGAVLDAFDADLATCRPSSIGVLERGRLRGVVRALLVLALDDPAFDATVTIAPTGAAVRVHHPAGVGPTARLVVERAEPLTEPLTEPFAEAPPVSGAPASTAASTPASTASATAASELAELLRRGRLGGR